MGKYITMKTKNTLKSLKKIPYYFALTLLTAGASLILGFLSFSGMYALSPILAFAGATFALSVAYEGEIYLQNIKGALAKLFKSNYLEHRLAKEYLSTHFTEQSNDEECPQFFKDYKAELLKLDRLNRNILSLTAREHKLHSFYPQSSLIKELNKRKKQTKTKLKDMEQWFAQHLFPKSTPSSQQSNYTSQLQKWLAEHEQDEWQKQLQSRRKHFNFAKGFSALAALFMGLGSTYLIVEAFSVIPFFAPFAFTPAIILPMAIIAGTAYGLLTYNAITDLINNNTVLKWYNRLKADLKQGVTARNVFMTITASFLVTLAIALTICTAGTWWTIATNARPLFSWMGKMPSFIMGIINPIITGASAIFFNIQNSAESLDMVDAAMRNAKNILQKVKKAISDDWNHSRQTENGMQLLNPFRILLKLTITPLRVLFFLGHLVSIALTSDRMPGVPQTASALVAIISEGFEDAHYFIGHEHEDEPHHQDKHQHGHTHPHHADVKELLKERLDAGAGHEHGTDIPTVLLHVIFAPIYALATIWDSLSSSFNKPESNKKVLSLKEAWHKQRGTTAEQEVILCVNTHSKSTDWQAEHALYLIEQQKSKLKQARVNPKIAEEKITQLEHLQNELLTKPQAMRDILSKEKAKPVYNRHRIFALEKQTSTQQFIEELPQRIAANPS